MNAHEHTDPDGDSLTITTNGDRAWVTCTTATAEITVGPIPVTRLTSTSESLTASCDMGDDLMDGGVTAALIEQEVAGSYTRTDDDGLTLLMVQQQRDQATARAEKAEKERDEARATKNMHKRRADEERARADAAAHPRTLTADDLDGEELRKRTERVQVDVLRAHRESRADWARIAVFAALTPQPARPEGAEELDPIVDEFLTSYWRGDIDGADATDWLAERGVRVTGAEQ